MERPNHLHQHLQLTILSYPESKSRIPLFRKSVSSPNQILLLIRLPQRVIFFLSQKAEHPHSYSSHAVLHNVLQRSLYPVVPKGGRRALVLVAFYLVRPLGCTRIWCKLHRHAETFAA